LEFDPNNLTLTQNKENLPVQELNKHEEISNSYETTESTSEGIPIEITTQYLSCDYCIRFSQYSWLGI
jgi:hypothetical protein